MSLPASSVPSLDSVVLDPAKQSKLLAALYIIQEQHGYLTRDAMARVAQRLGLTPGEVYSTASFYTLFRDEPAGRFVIQVCDGLSCYLADGAERIVDPLAAAQTAVGEA